MCVIRCLLFVVQLQCHPKQATRQLKINIALLNRFGRSFVLENTHQHGEDLVDPTGGIAT